MILIAILAIGLFLVLRFPLAAWSGATWVNLSIEVEDAATGRPIPGANVQLVESWDPEYRKPPVQGMTGPDGLVALRGEFSCCGSDSLIGSRMNYISCHGWWIRVDAPGYQPFLARLDEGETERFVIMGKLRYTDPTPTDPPLALRFPPSSTIVLRLRRDRP